MVEFVERCPACGVEIRTQIVENTPIYFGRFCRACGQPSDYPQTQIVRSEGVKKALGLPYS